MGKNILIISTTPRKNGNSEILYQEFMRGARYAGHDVEKIRLSEKEISYCTKCRTCIADRSEAKELSLADCGDNS